MRDKPRILIVDDDPINIQLLTKTVQGTYDIFTATNGWGLSTILCKCFFS
jgi:CheY-like chemotaxis protein